MIIYNESWFGIPTLTRMNGSALVRGFVPTIVSTGILFAFIVQPWFDFETDPAWSIAKAPYVVGALMAAFTFLLTFRANFAYGRYWEACGAVYQMHSKWMECALNSSAFHMQSSQYDNSRPLSYADYPNLDRKLRRESKGAGIYKESSGTKKVSTIDKMVKKAFYSSAEKDKDGDLEMAEMERSLKGMNCKSFMHRAGTLNQKSDDRVTSLKLESRLDGGIQTQVASLFLQELTHMLSLLSAVALSTLRNDVEGAQSPLIEYKAGEAFPPQDPDQFDSKKKKMFGQKNSFVTSILYAFGYTRSDYHRTLYNAARPFRVIGGISEGECKLLQEANGPLAKVALVELWLLEFITREHLCGSTGKVPPPIVGRLHLAATDGFTAYNQARKVAFTPFPFPHAQIAVFFTLVTMVIIPLLMISYTSSKLVAALMNFFTVLVFTGLHEVARELERPFKNAPNDLPLNYYQAQFNEALVSMTAGFHPDSFWEAPEDAHEEELGAIKEE